MTAPSSLTTALPAASHAATSATAVPVAPISGASLADSFILGMPNMDWYSWGVILGLALVITGSLILWAYGRPSANRVDDATLSRLPEDAARMRLFLNRSSKGLAFYALLAIAGGLALTFGAGSALFFLPPV